MKNKSSNNHTYSICLKHGIASTGNQGTNVKVQEGEGPQCLVARDYIAYSNQCCSSQRKMIFLISGKTTIVHFV